MILREVKKFEGNKEKKLYQLFLNYERVYLYLYEEYTIKSWKKEHNIFRVPRAIFFMSKPAKERSFMAAMMPWMKPKY